jgi:hypothetical protein
MKSKGLNYNILIDLVLKLIFSFFFQLLIIFIGKRLFLFIFNILIKECNNFFNRRGFHIFIETIKSKIWYFFGLKIS